MQKPSKNSKFKALRSFLVLLMLSLSLNLVKADFSKVFELEYKDSNLIYMHADSKATIMLNHLPYEVDKIQLSSVNKEGKPRVYILGKKIINVSEGNNNFAKFNIELANVKSLSKQSGEIHIKAYSSDGEKRTIVSKAKIFIRPILCPKTKDHVCGYIHVQKRTRLGYIDEYKEKTFLNQCHLERELGELLHHGVCEAQG